MNAAIIADLEQRLNKRLDPAREGAISNLNDLPLDVIADARFLDKTVGAVLRTALLWFYIPISEHVYLPSFVEDVIKGDADPATWERGGALYLITLQTRQLLERSVGEFLSPLQTAAGKDAQAWLRIVPNYSQWEAGDIAVGSPAVAPMSLDYHWHTLYGVARTIAPNHRLEPITEDIQLATRRWIASRLAWESCKAQISLRDSNADALVRKLIPGPTITISDDARIAIDALLREEKELDGIQPEAIPGFRGPEEWFAQRERQELNP